MQEEYLADEWVQIHPDFSLKRDKNYQQIWQEQDFTKTRVQAWIENGLKITDYELASYLRTKNIQPSSDLIKQIKKQGIPAQEYLNWKYPLKERNKITDLNIRGKNLEGKLELTNFFNLKNLACCENNLTDLDLSDCHNLTELICYVNPMTSTNFLSTLPNPEKLTYLDMGDNNFDEQDLSFLEKFIGLEELYLWTCEQKRINKGLYNRFTGSLQPPQNLNKLWTLSISDTDINQGVEYLPVSIRKLDCSTKLRPTCQLTKITEELKEFKNNLKNYLLKKIKETENKAILLNNNLNQFLNYPKPILQNKLGEGGFAIVYQGIWKGNPVAIKQSKFSSATMTNQELVIFEKEVEFLKKLNNPYIILYIDMFKDSKDLMIITELAQYGTLTDYINSHQNKKYDWKTNYNFIKQMSLGLSYLHHSNIIHRDLKSMNILICEGNIAKIADFGISKVINELATNRTTSKGAGTMAWMDPYYFKARTHSFATDIYSLGMVFWEIVAKKLPHAHIPHDFIICQILAGNSEEIPTYTPLILKEIIEGCWKEENPNERINLSEIEQKINQEIKKEQLAQVEISPK